VCTEYVSSWDEHVHVHLITSVHTGVCKVVHVRINMCVLNV